MFSRLALRRLRAGFRRPLSKADIAPFFQGNVLPADKTIAPNSEVELVPTAGGIRFENVSITVI